MAQESRLVIVIDSSNAERNSRALSQELANIERRGDFATQSTDRLGAATRQLAGYMAGLLTVGAAVSKMDAYTNLNNRLRLVTDSQVALNKAMQDTFDIAQRSGAEWGGTAAIYQKVLYNSEKLGLSQEKVGKITESISKSISNSGSSAQAASAALYQLGQSFDKSSLNGDEFVSMSENAGYLMEVFAKGLGVTRAELKEMSSQGLLTTDKMIQAIEKMSGSIEADFGKTNFTIGQSFMQLSNAVTKFTGEAGQSSGAALFLSNTLQGLAKNLEPIANVAILGGVALLTKMILTQTVAIKTAVGASIARRAAQVAEAESAVRLTSLEVQRQRQVTTLAAQEVGLARAEYNSATTRSARAAATIRLTQAEIAHRIALNQTTAAIGANTAAQNALNASRAIGSRLLALVGGPIGAITLGVTALAAGYMYLQGRTEAATKKLEEQAKVAEKTSEELKKLQGTDRKTAINDLTSAFEAQNKELKKTEQSVGAALIEIQNYGQGNVEITRISNAARLGTISYKEAVEQLAALKLPPSLRDALKDQIDKYNEAYDKADKTKTAIKLFGIELVITGNKAQNAAIEQQKHTNAINETKKAADDASKSLEQMYADRRNYAEFKRILIETYGLSKDAAEELAKAQEKMGGFSTRLSPKVVQGVLKTIEAEQRYKNIVDEANNKQKERTKELEKQEKLTKRLVGISGNSGIGTGAHLDVRYSGSMSGQRVSNEHLARLKAADKPLSAYRVSSDYGPRKAPTKGASSFHKGIDFAMPVGTPITTNVAVKDVQTAYDPKGGGYYSTVTFEDGVVLKLLHQSPSMQGKVKGGASKGSDKAGVDIQSQIERQLDAQRALENEVAGEVQRIKNNLTVRLEDVDKAGFTPERSAEIKAELQRRADNDIAIAQQALRTKLDDYKEFQKTEVELLKENFDRRKFNATHDIELTKVEQKQAVELLEQQYQQEIGLMQLAQEQRLFQVKLVLMSETEAMQERYRLKREEIQKNTKLSVDERQKMITFSKAAQENEMRNKIVGAVQNWGGIQADMNGYGDFYRQDQDRFSRLGTAQDLFDSKSAAVDYNEQGGLDAIKAQMEQQLISQQEFEDQKTAILQVAQDQRKIIAAEYAQNAKDIEDKYQQDRLNTQIAFGGQMMGSLTSMFGSMFGEQSKAYKIMFAADKAYAIAAAGIAIQQNIAAASKAGFPYNLPLIAGAIAQGASIIANIRAIKDQGFADGGYTGKGGKYELAGSVHKGEVVWSQADIKRWGGVNLVESMRKSANPEAFLKNNASSDVMRRAMMSSQAFMDAQRNKDNQIIYKPNKTADTSRISTGSELVHDGKVYFSPNGLVQDRSNLEDVYDFTLGRSARPQVETIASVQPSAPSINFKIEVVNQVKGVAVEAEQVDENTVRLIVKDELENTLPRAVPRIVSEQMDDPSSAISRSLSKNTTARRNR
ncbi:tape measure protein [Acinetobacter gyllenbergii]|uniref:tape measure protein n=1 Tax=Acinetobacter gyllenbergii TaxID=134534 RepID=UPI000806C555|nr:tape measure protein [Acinetobacter gyllenbergii]OBY75256.1 phage tail length tape measure protein [Acinetobacter gyllenbergii]